MPEDLSAWVTVLYGDARIRLAELAAGCVDCVVTSPPYWRQRDCGHPSQIGMEPSLSAYVENLVEVFRLVRRALTPTGTVWVNLGDANARKLPGIRNKDLVGIPWRVALALQDDGWFLRSDVIWEKPNCMPDSCRDRFTRSHEYLFLLSREPRHYFDADSVVEPSVSRYPSYNVQRAERKEDVVTAKGYGVPWEWKPTRHRRTVWRIPRQLRQGRHSATFPEKLVEICVKAGCPDGGLVLDPFSGTGTTGRVATRLGRHYIGVELVDEHYARQLEDFNTEEDS